MICMAGGFAEGGITGRASCAWSELTTPKLGARWLVIKLGTARPLGDGAGDDTEGLEPPVIPTLLPPPPPPPLLLLLPPLFCSSCFSNTFCESSDFDIPPVDDEEEEEEVEEDMLENLHPLPVDASGFATADDEPTTDAGAVGSVAPDEPEVIDEEEELTFVSSETLSTGSILTTLAASRLSRFERICEADSPRSCPWWPGASSVDFERRKAVAFCS